LKAKLERLKRSRKELEEVGRMMKELQKDEVSLTDPESRLMKNNGKIEVCYNSELSVDSKEHIIVNYDVTNEANDSNQLAPMAKETKEALHVEKLEVTADSGFVDMEQIEDCLKNGVTPYLPAAALDGSAGQGRVPDPGRFGKDKFAYDGKRDAYVCPAGKELKFKYASPYNKAGKILRRYATDACSACPFKALCTSGKRGRIVSRWEHQEIIDELLTKVRLEPEKLDARVKLAEHPFGTIKRAFNQGYFLLKGLRKVKGEMGLTALAYDIRRALNILGTKALTALIRAR
jgi:transposase